LSTPYRYGPPSPIRRSTTNAYCDCDSCDCGSRKRRGRREADDSIAASVHTNVVDIELELDVREFTRLPRSPTKHPIIRILSQPLYPYSFVPNNRTVEALPTSKSKFPCSEISRTSSYSFSKVSTWSYYYACLREIEGRWWYQTRVTSLFHSTRGWVMGLVEKEREREKEQG
jgi:hypothetical protein